MKNDPQFLIVHTAAHEGAGYDIEDVDRWHRQRGFRACGYHYFIHKDGTLEQGRPEDLHGAHCRDDDMNFRSLGICFQGHGDHEPFTDAQKGTLIRLYRKVDRQYGIPVENVHGHRRHNSNKTCPGTKVSMKNLRAMLEATPATPDPPEPAETAPLITFDTEIDNIPNSL